MITPKAFSSLSTAEIEMANAINQNICDNTRRMAKHWGVSQRTLAHYLGINLSTLSEYMRGTIRPWRLHHVYLMAHLFGMGTSTMMLSNDEDFVATKVLRETEWRRLALMRITTVSEDYLEDLLRHVEERRVVVSRAWEPLRRYSRTDHVPPASLCALREGVYIDWEIQWFGQPKLMPVFERVGP